MAQTYTEQFYVMDPGNPPDPGTSLTVQTFQFTDRNDDGEISRAGGDTFEGHTITRVWDGDTVKVDIPGEGTVTLMGVTFYMQGHPAVFVPTDGAVLKDAVFLSSTYVTVSSQLDLDTLAPACFTPGTLIDTPGGPRTVEDIRAGDIVVTRDDGPQPVCWVARRRVCGSGDLAPVRIDAGGLNNTAPLIVSPQHRILIEGWPAELYAGEAALLVPALHLVNGTTIRRKPVKWVDYIHLGFASHALVRSAAQWSESHFASAAARRERENLMLRTVRPAAEGHVSQVIGVSMALS